jgi:hypothetical protein
MKSMMYHEKSQRLASLFKFSNKVGSCGQLAIALLAAGGLA